MEQSKKPGVNTLVPDQEIGGHVIRPWTLAQVIELTDDIEDTAKTLVKAGLSMDKFQKDPMSLVKVIAPRLPRYIGVTLGIPEDEAGSLPVGDATLIALTIVRQNLNHLKNLFGPANQALRELALLMTLSGNSSGPSKDSSPEDTTSEPSSTSTDLTS